MTPAPTQEPTMTAAPPTATASEPNPRGALAGKHITFRVGDERYALHIRVVREILGLLPITRVPHAPPEVRGVVNLRGRVIAVTDLRRKFQTATQEDTDQTVIIVTQLPAEDAETTLGLVVDEVIEVTDLSADQIQLPPSLDSDGVGFLAGTAHVDGSLVFLLDLPATIAHAPTPTPQADARVPAPEIRSQTEERS